MTAAANGGQRPLRPYVLLFVLLSVIYHSNLRPVAAGDSFPGSLIPFSVILDGSVTLDRFGPWMDEHNAYSSRVVQKAGGHWYSWYPIAGPVLASPLYLPVALTPWVRHQSAGTLVSIARVWEKVTAVTLAAASALALLCLLRRLTSRRLAMVLTLVFALGTASWSTSSQALWPHTFGQLAIIATLYAIERLSSAESESPWYWIAGACAGCALAIRLTNLLLLPALALALWSRNAKPRDYVRIFVPPALAAAPVAAYNFLVFHRLAGGYATQLGRHFFDGLSGILISPGRGLLIYTPVAIFALAALMPHAREARDRHRPVLVAAGVFSLLYVVLMAAWPDWWGGYCWGPRMLTEILPGLMVLIAIGWPAIEARGWEGAFAGVALYCVLIQAIGVYCYPKGAWDALPVSVDVDPGRLWNWGDNPIIRTVRGGVVWEPYAIVAAAATGGLPAAAKKLHELGINPY
jgi:hypothetical protein